MFCVHQLDQRARHPPSSHSQFNTQKSLTCYVLLLGTSPISWKSKKQSTFPNHLLRPNTKPCIKKLPKLLGLFVYWERWESPNFNQSLSIAIINLPSTYQKISIFHGRTKQIDIHNHFIHEKVPEGLIQVTYLPSQSQIANIFTKHLPSFQFHILMSMLEFLTLISHLSLRCGKRGYKNPSYTQLHIFCTYIHPLLTLAHQAQFSFFSFVFTVMFCFQLFASVVFLFLFFFTGGGSNFA